MSRLWLFAIGRAVKVETVRVHHKELHFAVLKDLSNDGGTRFRLMLSSRRSVTLVMHNASDRRRHNSPKVIKCNAHFLTLSDKRVKIKSR